jgi:hypothetical protein
MRADVAWLVEVTWTRFERFVSFRDVASRGLLMPACESVACGVDPQAV